MVDCRGPWPYDTDWVAMTKDTERNNSGSFLLQRRASCSCGQLSLICEGEPIRISMCHCLACQQRTGSAFGVQARFDRSQVHTVEGQSIEYLRTADSGNRARFHFCPVCGSTVYWEMEALPDAVAVAVGAFADSQFPAPTVSVYEVRRHSWVAVPDLKVEHYD